VGKVKERREVGEGDDTVIVEDTSDDDDEDEESMLSPWRRATRACGPQWGNRREAGVQPPLSKNFWRSWSARPLL
jgi:hypothetical protein